MVGDDCETYHLRLEKQSGLDTDKVLVPSRRLTQRDKSWPGASGPPASTVQSGGRTQVFLVLPDPNYLIRLNIIFYIYLKLFLSTDILTIMYFVSNTPVRPVTCHQNLVIYVGPTETTARRGKLFSVDPS